MNKKPKYTLDELLDKRRSVRKFSKKPLSLEKMIAIKKAARKAPSAGALRPVTVHIVDNHDGKSPVSQSIWKAAIKQKVILRAKALIIFCVDFEKMQRKYNNRGNRYALLEVGHMAQNVCLKAIELGLATCCVGAFKDSKIKGILGCNESPVYIIAVGYPE